MPDIFPHDCYLYYHAETCQPRKSATSQAEEKTNQKTYMVKQYIANFIGVTVLTLTFVPGMFMGFGDGTGDFRTVQIFLLLFLPIFVVIQTSNSLRKERNDFIRGKWVMHPYNTNCGQFLPLNPWRRIMPLSIGIGLGSALVAYSIMLLIGSNSFSLLFIVLISYISLLLASMAAISIAIPRDQKIFTSALSNPSSQRSLPFIRYSLFNHIIPMIPLQTILHFGIGFKQFQERDIISLTHMTFGFCVVSLLVLILTWVSSQSQVRSDIHLGRYSIPQTSNWITSELAQMNVAIHIFLTLFFFILISIVSAFVMTWILDRANIEVFSVFQASLLRAIVALFSTFFGCWIGILWGSRREAIILYKTSTYPKV